MAVQAPSKKFSNCSEAGPVAGLFAAESLTLSATIRQAQTKQNHGGFLEPRQTRNQHFGADVCSYIHAMRIRRNLLILAFVIGGPSFVSFRINAQNSPAVSSPPAPKPRATPDLQSPVPAAGDPLYAPVVTSRVPQSLYERFIDYAIVTVGPRTLFVLPVYAAIRMADPPAAYPRDWRLGASAFGRNYGNALATRTSLETGRFLTAALLHEDFRYRLSTSKNPLVRTFHALAFTFLDKSDSERNRIAFANFVGAGASGFVGNLYLPAGFNDRSHAETRIAIAFGGFAAQNLLREFTPELLKATHKWHSPFPRIPLPEWWVKVPAH